ncbi:GCFC2 factor, partial [Polypterus senegalus]|nr:GC-rich sequence DNA-binding factor 2 [Polypterus senegalus]MBN3291388.1 GCFC2 factor [Polypterus senegalus]
MFKKPKRNFRTRKASSSDEDEVIGQGAEQTGESLSEVPASLESSEQAARSPEPVTERLDRVLSEVDPALNIVDRETLSETKNPQNIKRNLKSDRTEYNCTLSFQHETEDGSEFKVKKPAANAVLFKAPKKESHLAEDMNNIPDKELEDDMPKVSSSDEDSDKEDQLSTGSDDDSSSQTSSNSGSSRSGADAIPDAKCIEAAKRRRQLARVQKDYIPLNTNREYHRQGNGTVDSDEDSDDVNQIIHFAPKPRTLRQRIAETAGMDESEEEIPESLEDKDDDILWEKQQIGKGTKIPPMPCGPNLNETERTQKKCFVPSSLPPVNLETMKKRLTKRLESLLEVHRAHQRNQTKIQLDIENVRSSLENAENNISDELYRFYKEMRIYAHNLVDCLNEKVKLIDDLESEMHNLLKDQAQKQLNQRREEVKEESSYIQQLANNSSLSGICEKKNACLERLEQRRAHRRQMRKNTAEGSTHHEGLSSDDETEETELFMERRGVVLSESKQTFNDVNEDFYCIKNILVKFDRWRSTFPDSYYNAYISFCLPKLLAPLIRHCLIDWNPLKVDCEDFESMSWYLAVEEFCYGKQPENPEVKDNPDFKVLPSVINKVLIPKLQGFVEHMWDPSSSTQTRCLISLCKKMDAKYSSFGTENNKAAQSFLNAVISRLRTAVDEDAFIPIYSKRLLEDRSSLQCQFQDRQFWSVVKILQNILMWNGLVEEHTVRELGLDKLLNRYLLTTLLNSPGQGQLEKCKKIVECLPEQWFKDVDGRCSLLQLKNFSSYLLQMAHNLHGSHLAEEGVRDVVLMLVKIKALDQAESVVAKYHLEDLNLI